MLIISLGRIQLLSRRSPTRLGGGERKLCGSTLLLAVNCASKPHADSSLHLLVFVHSTVTASIVLLRTYRRSYCGPLNGLQVRHCGRTRFPSSHWPLTTQSRIRAAQRVVSAHETRAERSPAWPFPLVPLRRLAAYALGTGSASARYAGNDIVDKDIDDFDSTQ